MKERDYCQLVFLGLINLLSFLFSTIFFVSASNIKSMKDSEVTDDDACKIFGIINNHFTSNEVLFSFQVIWLFIFFILAMSYYKIYEKEDNKVITYQNINPHIEENINVPETNNNKKPSYLKRAMIVMFIFSQAFYAIKLILVPVFYYKIKLNPDEECETFSKNAILKSYRDIIVVGYIFFVFIFLPIYIILLVLFFKKEEFSSTIFCNCFTHNITNCCKFLSNCSKKCHTSEVLREKNAERQKQINDLIVYRDKLKIINQNMKEGVEQREEEFTKLNLKKY